MKFTTAEKRAFSKMGKASKEKRLGGKSKEEISEYMKAVRARKTPKISL